MKTAIIIHGMPDKENYFDPKADSQSNCHWLPWLQQQLNCRDILAQTPEMPEPYNPNYETWKKVFERFEINDDTILVGHSCGGGFLVKYLSEYDGKVGKVVLVAPWINIDREDDVTMFDGLEIDKNLVAKTKGIAIFASTNDDENIQKSINVLKSTINNVKIMEFENYGHFCLGDMGTREFPELLEEVVKVN